MISEAADLLATAADCGSELSALEWQELGQLQLAVCRYEAAQAAFEKCLSFSSSQSSPTDPYTAHIGLALAKLGDGSGGTTSMADGALDRVLDMALQAKAWRAALSIQEVRIRLRERRGEFASIRRLLDQVMLWPLPTDRKTGLHAAKVLALSSVYGNPDLGRAMTDHLIEGWRQAGRLPLDMIHRALVGLLYQGRVGTPTGRAIQGAVLQAATEAEDLRLLFRTHNALAVWYCDLGMPAAAVPHLEKASEVLRTTRVLHDDLVLRANWGEVLLSLGDLSAAEAQFRTGLEASRAGCTDHLKNVLLAGLSRCSLEGGSLSKAREYAEEIRLPSRWWYEPTLIAQAYSSVLARSGQGEEALAFLRSVITDIRHRLVLPWLSLAVDYCRIAVKMEAAGWRELGEEALEAAVGLGIPGRANALRRYIGQE